MHRTRPLFSALIMSATNNSIPANTNAAAAASVSASSVPFFTSNHSIGSTRLGRFASHPNFTTPNFFLSTDRFAPQYLTPEMLKSKLPAVIGLHLTASELFAQPIETSLHSLDLESNLLYFTCRNPSLDAFGPTNDKNLSLSSFGGNIRLSPTDYLESLFRHYRPNFIEFMSDELPSNSTNGRIAKGTSRSLEWLDQQIKLSNELLLKYPNNTNTNTNTPNRIGLFAPIQGGGNIELREYCIREILKRDSYIDGYTINGLNSGESSEIRYKIIESICKIIQEYQINQNNSNTNNNTTNKYIKNSKFTNIKPIVLSNCSTPIEVLNGIKYGIDLFESNYPSICTSFGFASIYPLDLNNNNSSDSTASSSSSSSSSSMSLHLKDPQYKLSRSPILSSCQCFTCKTHTRGYLHHLLIANEMNGHILLEIHNIYHYQQLFYSIRNQIRTVNYQYNGNKEILYEWIEKLILLMNNNNNNNNTINEIELINNEYTKLKGNNNHLNNNNRQYQMHMNKKNEKNNNNQINNNNNNNEFNDNNMYNNNMYNNTMNNNNNNNNSTNIENDNDNEFTSRGGKRRKVLSKEENHPME